ncbi:acetyl/propionyl/methylcrotonyl-CoA carboxylase subunit alpha [Porticoccaceae bacterium]|nr:acetyl/propionyl/methylcrotonyl-CoA carboxylase subunit alpha [Porticoccaceae bacterium]MDC0010640.1 acetyl/propionyl/methylcrotonyl-CoA carboxylase subunit alpha [Porticoccaceae bacterium]
MFTKILIANRGEIACRIIQTAKKMDIKTVAVYSDADRNSLHVSQADEAIHIGPSPSNESYLVIDKIIQAALSSGAQAIHPGYGFLSENADFCRQCEANNLVFIGPPVEAILAMGSKSAAKNIMAKANVPLVPGYHGDDQSPAILKQSAENMGYPVLLKAAAGGGGKGMRAVYHADEFDQALAAAKREAKNSFNDEIMLVEKYLQQPRHVEIQVFCDQHNNAVHLFERDCSLQRRHQKVIEEAPAPGMTEELRQRMGEAAIRAAIAINYQGAGTVEFLLDSSGEFFFMEMNTRLQVEHPVTEMISGQDLVEWQLRVANSEPLPCTQDQLNIKGNAFEARIYAEDPDHDFLPSTGRLTVLQAPLETAHVRIDSGVTQGDEISVFYDPMITKLVVWDIDRERALERLIQALSEYKIAGVTTNMAFLYNLASSQAFRRGDVNTGFIEEHEDEIFHRRQADLDYAAPLAAQAILSERKNTAQDLAEQSNEPNSPWHLVNHWRISDNSPQQLNITIGTEQVEAMAADSALPANIKVVSDESGFKLFTPNGVFHCAATQPDLGLDQAQESGGNLAAPMNGTVVTLLVGVGAMVAKGETLMVMEAMKMEHSIVAPSDGKVSEFFYQPGELVDGGAELLAFEIAET